MTTRLDEISAALGTLWNHALLHIDGKAVSVGSLCVGVAIVILGFWMAKKLSRQLSNLMEHRFSVHHESIGPIQTFSYYALIVLFTVFALNVANIPMTIFTVAGGALAIGVGFGSQNVVNNFISGLILLIEQPIRIDDYVEVDGVFGKVQRIGFRSTTILVVGNRELIVPNSSFLEKNVLNWTRNNRMVRLDVEVGVAYGSPLKQVEALLMEACRETEGILTDPAPLILFTDFGDNALKFKITFSVEFLQLRDRSASASRLRYLIDEKFREAGISMPFPQRDIHLFAGDPIPVKITGTPPISG